ncbi:uracil-xanthine permease family protein [Sphaerisporangium corydalis]|uniref:Uracil-xanthine permease family protein n=1 Tax=Sphaerisporangium corydalis TaxID=1441875 RepID=A0ABV9EPP5_9ACTN|nr:solute carrier family 23 protein [Sphaerisporangium corydalis]
MAFGWKLHGDGRSLAPGEVVKPDERLSWPRMVGFGAQHVIAMFGATFVFPVVMGLNPNLAIMMSGVATILFLLIVQGKIPSYLGTSASFVGAVAAINAAGGGSGTVTGAILVAGAVLALCGVAIHYLGIQIIHKIFPPVVTGAVVMLIGFGLAYVVADFYWWHDPWIALITMVVTGVIIVAFKGFIGRIGILLGLVIGFLLSIGADKIIGNITAHDPLSGQNVTGPRVNFQSVSDADLFGWPAMHPPQFAMSAIVLVLPAVIALIAENVGHVKAVGEMTGVDVDPLIGRAIFADGLGTVVASATGGSPTTTYAENIGVMAATRVYSTAAYYIAAVVAIGFGLVPKFGALVAATPSGVLGGITVILYGMIGLLGAKIWIENRVDFSDPVNMVPIGAGIILAIGPVSHQITKDFSLAGIALGTIVVLGGYHLLRAISGRTPAGGDSGASPALAEGSGSGT